MRKPKNKTPVQLPIAQPDCCAECPLCGLIPKEERPFGSKETHLCLGTWHALNARFIRSRASAKDSHHPLRRWCDATWEAWITLPERMFILRDMDYTRYRVPYESSIQRTIIFHNR